MTQLLHLLTLSVLLLVTSNVQSESPAPDHIITRSDIENSGHLYLGDILNEQSYLQSGLNHLKNNGGTGEINSTARHLGTMSTLVLINGQEQVNGLYGGTDLSVFPLISVQEVRISLDQPSSKHQFAGAAAVIDIITRKSPASELQAFAGITSKDDGEKHSISYITSGEHSRGQWMFSAEHSKSESIDASDRFFSRLPLFATGLSRASSVNPQGLFIIYTPLGAPNLNDDCGVLFGFASFCTTLPGSNGIQGPNDPDLVTMGEQYRYNFAEQLFLLTPQENSTAFVTNSFKINESTEWNTELFYSNKKNRQQLAPTPLSFGDSFRSLPYGRITIGEDNPFNPYGVDIDPSDILLIGRRTVELGNRVFRRSTQSLYFNNRISGTMGQSQNWNWEAYLNHSESTFHTNDTGLIRNERILESLSSACVTDSNCVPLDLFGGAGSITPEMASFISGVNRDSSTQRYTTIGFDLNTPVFSNTSVLTGGLSHQMRSSKYTNGLMGNPNQNSPFKRDGHNDSYQLNNLYTSLESRLWNSDDEQKSLHSIFQWGYTDSSEAKGQFSYLSAIHWNINPQFQLQFQHSKSLQHPSLINLFGGLEYRYQQLRDPCVGNSDYPGCPLQMNPQGFENIVEQVNQGNPKLEAAEVKSNVIKLKYQSSSWEGFKANLSFFQYKNENLLQLISAQEVLNSCAITGTLYCDRIISNDSGDYIMQIEEFLTNHKDSNSKTSGADLHIQQTHSTETGHFEINWYTSYFKELSLSLFKYDQFNGYQSEEVDFLNVVNSYHTIQNEKPRLQSHLNGSWSHNDWKVSYQVRFIGEHDEPCSTDLNLGEGDNGDFRPDEYVTDDFVWCTYQSQDSSFDDLNDTRKIGSAAFHDLSLSRNIKSWNSTLIFGVNNVFDKAPPLSSQEEANSYESDLYDGTGRFYWMRVSKEF